MERPSTSSAGLAESSMSLSQQLGIAEGSRKPARLIIPIPEEPMQNSVPFRRLVLNFSLVPALSVLEFLIAFLGFLLVSPDPPHAPNFLAILVAVAFWSLSHHLGPPLFRIFDLATDSLPENAWSEGLLEAVSTLIHVAIKELARFAAVLLLYRSGHPTLIDVLWLGFGWALGDVVCGIYQNYLHLYQYRDGLLPGDESHLSAAPWLGSRAGEIIVSPETDGENQTFANGGLDEDYEAAMEVELAKLTALKARIELEDIYGIPFPDIPVIIISIQWLDALLLSIGLTLIMSHPFSSSGEITTSLPVVAVTWAIHSCLALGYALAMPKIGPHAVNYFGLIVSIGCLVGGLAEWGVLE